LLVDSVGHEENSFIPLTSGRTQCFREARRSCCTTRVPKQGNLNNRDTKGMCELQWGQDNCRGGCS